MVCTCRIWISYIRYAMRYNAKSVNHNLLDMLQGQLL